MAFDSFGAFIAMGGHGPYVWACYVVFFGLSLVLIVWSSRQRKAAIQGVMRRQARTDQAVRGDASADFARVDATDR